jgi:hypothetical protein
MELRIHSREIRTTTGLGSGKIYSPGIRPADAVGGSVDVSIMRIGTHFDNIAAIRGNTGPVTAKVMKVHPIGGGSSALTEYIIMSIKIRPIAGVAPVSGSNSRRQ